jgi:hypothetical protein
MLLTRSRNAAHYWQILILKRDQCWYVSERDALLYFLFLQHFPCYTVQLAYFYPLTNWGRLQGLASVLRRGVWLLRGIVCQKAVISKTSSSYMSGHVLLIFDRKMHVWEKHRSRDDIYIASGVCFCISADTCKVETSSTVEFTQRYFHSLSLVSDWVKCAKGKFHAIAMFVVVNIHEHFIHKLWSQQDVFLHKITLTLLQHFFDITIELESATIFKFMTLSASQNKYRPEVRWLMDDELKRIWKQLVIT